MYGASKERQSQQSFYRPYNSDDEEESDSDTTYSTTSTHEPEFTSPKALAKAAGGSLPTARRQIEYGLDEIGRNMNYGYYDPPPALSNIDYGGTTFNTHATSVDNIIILNSRDRDHQVYPQPTNVVLRLPRVYRNITKIAFTDFKLLSAFYYFSPTKGNVTYYIQEQGRTNPFALQGTPSNAFPVTIDTGSYDINSLIAELNQMMNLYPIFYYFTGGITEFAQNFNSTGDLAAGFNQVGDYFFDPTQNIYVTPPTLTLTYVTQVFFQARYLYRTNFTLQETLCAYYYPPLKLYLLTNLNNLPSSQVSLALTPATSNYLLPLETPLSRTLYTFQGIDDPVVAEIINNNVTFLDSFRIQNTFLNALVNRYVASVDVTQNLVTILAPTLNTSLVTLLTNQYNTAFAVALNTAGLSQSNFNASNSQLSLLNATLLSMYTYLQTNLAISFAVNYNTYTLSYLATPTYQIYIRDGLNASNIETSLTSNVFYSGIPPASNFSFQSNAPAGYWSNLIDTQSNTFTLINNESSPFVNLYSIYYNGIVSQTIVASNTSNINTDLRSHTADLIVPVAAEKYSVLAFHSPVRQTLQIETLPRPIQYRYPAYNALYNSAQIQTLFNYTYQFIENSNSDISLPYDLIEAGGTWDTLITVVTGTQFGQTATQGLSNASNFIGTCTPFTYYTSLFYKITTPYVYGNPIPGIVNKYPFTFQIGGQPTPITTFMYHDRAVMMADIEYQFSENSNNYKIMCNTFPGSNTTLTWNAYENNTYYIVIRPTQIPFTKFVVTPVFYFPQGSNYTSFTTIATTMDPTIDPTTDPNFYSNFNYAQVYDPDFIHLPISSNLWGGLSQQQSCNNSTVISYAPPIGYDIYGNSFDLTDYRPFILQTGRTAFSTKYYYDPIGLNQDYFNFLSPYSTSNQTYFWTVPAGNQNSILIGSNLISCNVPGPTAARQYKLLNWYDSVYIGPTIPPLSNISTIYTKSPFNIAATCNIRLGGYNYDASSNLSLYDGVCGFTFLPEDGVWSLTGITFNSAVMSKSNNNNLNILYVGIYNTVSVGDVGALALSNALVALTLSQRQYYLPSQSNNTAFSNEFAAASPIDYYYFGNPNVQYGSYYTFTANSGSALLGYTQNPRSFINQPEDLYSAITFDSNGIPTSISQLTGSLVPYPTLSYPVPSNVYFDGSAPLNGKELIQPSPVAEGVLPFGVDFTQVGFAQSMLYTTTALHMLNETQQIYDDIAIKPWSGYELQGPITGISAKIPGYVIINDGTYKVYSYTNDVSRQFTLTASFTGDAVSDPIAFATNSSAVYFLSLQSAASAQSNLVVLTSYTPSTGVFQSVSMTSPLYLSVSNTIVGFSIDNVPNFLLTTYLQSNYYDVYYYKNGIGTGLYNSYPLPVYIDLGSNDTSASIIFSSNILYQFEFNSFPGTVESYTISNISPSQVDDVVRVDEGGGVAYYCLLAASNTQYGEIFLNGSTGYLVESTQQFTVPLTDMVSGAYGSKWVLQGHTQILANRYILDGTIETAWQIFYPAYKFTFNKIANGSVPIVDLTGIQPPEYFHTNLFIYNSFSALSNDIWSSWGAESPSNYLVADTQFSGFQFNSYINNVPLESNVIYYMVVRGYAPSEQFETMVRFYLPNRYDFRWLTLVDISNEIQIATQFMASNNGLTPFNFNPDYAYSLSNFNNAFIGNMIFGANTIPGFAGITSDPFNSNTTNWIGFGDFYYAFYNLYNEFVAINTLVTTVNTAALAAVNTFIATELNGILPSNALTRSRYTDPLLFSLLFGSGNSYQFSNAVEEWGIGWNLGFPKVDTPYLTIQEGNSFFKILDDYIYMKLNEEFNLNNIDSTGPENLQATRESTGMVGNYNSKIFLNTFGGYAQTAINNPAALNPPINKLDRFSLQLFDFRGNALSNNDCEWSCSLHVTENLTLATAGSSLIALGVPSMSNIP